MKDTEHENLEPYRTDGRGRGPKSRPEKDTHPSEGLILSSKDSRP